MLNRLGTATNQELMRYATYASVAAAGSIVIIKFVAWFITDSLSLLGSLADSVLDVLSSLINMAAVYYALRPADYEHRFGHGKAEDVAGLAQSTFIAGSALFIGIEAVKRFIHPVHMDHQMVGIVIMIISTILTVTLVGFQRYVINRTGSIIIHADSLHYFSDILVNLSIIGSLTASLIWSIEWLDWILAIIITLYILYGAWEIGFKAFNRLVDREWDDNKRKKIVDTAMTFSEVKGVHQLRTRDAGIKSFIQFHLELDGALTLNKAHEICDNVEAAIIKLFPQSEILIHPDPAMINEDHKTKV